jgi:CheY-like chemotaxis protein
MSISCILQVEDDANDVFLLQRALAQAEVRLPVQVASDGQMAIDYLAGTPPYDDRLKYPIPGLILLDLKLPRRSGREVLEWLRARQNLRRIVVIVFTTAQYVGDVGLAYDLGANSFLVKPEDFSQYVGIARLLKDWWLTLNQYAPVNEATWPLAMNYAEAYRYLGMRPEDRGRL